MRAAEGEYETDDGSLRFERRGYGAIGEVVYGSTSFDVGLGVEQFSAGGVRATRLNVESGIRRKIMVLDLSLVGQYGRIEGQEAASAALGTQYDMSRGLSANFVLNYEDGSVVLGDVRFLEARDAMAEFFIKYSF